MRFRKLIPSFLISFYHFLWALTSAFFYGFSSKKIKVIGVTGTNGKSTVVHLITKILEEADFKVASLSSIKFKIRNKEEKNKLKMTMPGRGRLQRFLKKALINNCDYAVIEVTSEGIKQYRHKFIDFNVAVFTNLTKEHIESHGSFKKYKKAKGKLFKECSGFHVINLDDKEADYFLQFKAQEKYGFSLLKEKDSLNSIKAERIEANSKGVTFKVKDVNFNLNLLGKFNIYNALAAISVALSQGINLKTCKRALERIKGIPGRMEAVIKNPFKVIVDYAHTPDSLKKVYQTFRGFKICVLGSCGGGRDKWKRKELGKIASNYCNKIILTNEDPYNEDPLRIIEDIEKGISQRDYEKIIDRREAIRKALNLAKDKDLVIITGKGAEPWICVAKGKKIPWDDREVVKEEIKRLRD